MKITIKEGCKKDRGMLFEAIPYGTAFTGFTRYWSDEHTSSSYTGALDVDGREIWFKTTSSDIVDLKTGNRWPAKHGLHIVDYRPFERMILE